MRLVVPAVVVLSIFGPAARAADPADARLAQAAMKRDTVTVRALVDQKVDVNAPGRDGTPALHWLVRVDDLETARLLIRAGADARRADRYGVTPLYLACANGNAAMIQLLLEVGADPNEADPTGETPLMTASRVGSLDAVRVLLDRGAVIDAKDPSFRQTALMIAVRENHPDVVRALIERRADVNAQTRTGPTPPWVLPNSVPGFGHGIGIVRGGLPERGSRYLIPGALTPLLYAARDGRLDLVRALLSAGADIERADANGITPLLMAISNNHMNVARFLVESGAAINVMDWYGRTPLWAAVEARNMDVNNAEPFENGVERAPVLDLIRVLLDRGADPNTRTKKRRPSGARCFPSPARSHGWTSRGRRRFSRRPCRVISRSCGCCSSTVRILTFRRLAARRR